MKVNLQPTPYETGRWLTDSRPEFRQVPLRRALPFWRSRQGWRIHRIRWGTVHIRERGSWLSVMWWCGQCAHSVIPVTEECREGLSPCEPCERAYRKHQEHGGNRRVTRAWRGAI